MCHRVPPELGPSGRPAGTIRCSTYPPSCFGGWARGPPKGGPLLIPPVLPPSWLADRPAVVSQRSGELTTRFPVEKGDIQIFDQ